jgi:hypothetical protein
MRACARASAVLASAAADATGRAQTALKRRAGAFEWKQSRTKAMQAVLDKKACQHACAHA